MRSNILLLSLSTLAILSTGCTHRIAVSGEGDIDANNGWNGCSAEQQVCNNVATDDYRVTYTARARSGWKFTHWSACDNASGANCRYNVSRQEVAANNGSTYGPTVAHFEVLGSNPIQFDNVTQAAGLGGSSTETFGAAWGDFNADGWPDLYSSNHRASGQLWRNNGNGTFSDISLAADQSSVFGPNTSREKDSHGAAWADIDNDGDQDLALTVAVSSGHLLRSNGQASLQDISASAGVQLGHDNGSRSVLFADFNNDGRTDQKILGTRETGGNVFLQQPNGRFVLQNDNLGLNCPLAHWAQLLDIDGKGGLEVLCGDNAGFPAQAYQLQGGRAVPIAVPTQPLSRDAVLGDFNNDGRQDILHIIGAFRPSGLNYVSDRAIEVQVSITGARAKTITVPTAGALQLQLNESNWNLIGRLGGGVNDVYIGSTGYNPQSLSLNLANSAVNRGVQNPNGRRGLFIGYVNGAWQATINNISGFSSAYFTFNFAAPIGNATLTPAAEGDVPARPRLMLNTFSGFTDATANSGLEPVQCVSGAAADFDNDMDLDVYLACRGATENLGNIVLENIDGRRFRQLANVGASGLRGAALAANAGTSDSVVTADYDRDGFVDVFVTNGLNLWPKFSGGPKQLFRNRGNNNNWLQFDLQGVQSNRDGIGAKVTVTSGGQLQYREQNGGHHRWAQNYSRLHFGLGPNSKASVTVEWPSGQRDIYRGIEANGVYRLVEGQRIEKR